MKSTTEHNWASLFIETALRAIRRIHFDYGVWGFGRQYHMKKSMVRLINMGPGIELADERAVCAAITQEFMSSQALAGFWVDENGPKERCFEIDREYNYFESPQKVDFFIKKLEGKAKKQAPFPSFIEAKRARIWRPNFAKAKAGPDPTNQSKDVIADVQKLRDEMNSRASKHAESILCHILVWGVYQKHMKGSDHPIDFFAELKDPNIGKPTMRWFPIVWENPERKHEKIRVIKSIWVALAEVDPIAAAPVKPRSL